jgi:hypothetical protein
MNPGVDVMIHFYAVLKDLPEEKLDILYAICDIEL